MDEKQQAEILDRYRKLGLVGQFGDTEGVLKFFTADADADFANQDARAGLDEVKAAGTTRLDQLRALAISVGIAKAKTEDKADGEAGFSERLLTVTASDDTTDRYGDRISVDGTIDGETLKGKGGKGRAKGWLLKEYAKNPVFMAFHEYTPCMSGNSFSGIPLGVALDTWIETGKNGSKALKQTVLFSDGTSNPLAPLILSAYKVERIMRGVSVGFAPVVAYWPQDDEERVRLKLGPWGVVFAEQTLLENSAVSIPANPSALAECFDFEDASREAGMLAWSDKAKSVAPDLAYAVRSLRRRTIVPVPADSTSPPPGNMEAAEPVAKSLDEAALAPLLSALVGLTERLAGVEKTLSGIAKTSERLERESTRTAPADDEEDAGDGESLFERVLASNRRALGVTDTTPTTN